MLGNCEVCKKECIGKNGQKYKRCFEHKETQVAQPVQKTIEVNYPPNSDEKQERKEIRIVRQNALAHATAIAIHNSTAKVLITPETVIEIAREFEKYVLS